jgi:hypothetical protein
VCISFIAAHNGIHRAGFTHSAADAQVFVDQRHRERASSTIVRWVQRLGGQ